MKQGSGRTVAQKPLLLRPHAGKSRSAGLLRSPRPPKGGREAAASLPEQLEKGLLLSALTLLLPDGDANISETQSERRLSFRSLDLKKEQNFVFQNNYKLTKSHKSTKSYHLITQPPAKVNLICAVFSFPKFHLLWFY